MKIVSYENFLLYGMGGGKRQTLHGSKLVMGNFFFTKTASFDCDFEARWLSQYDQ